MKCLFPLFLGCLMSQNLAAQGVETCRATQQNDTFTIENQHIARRFLWNNGNLISLSISDKKRGQTWLWVNKDPDASMPAHLKTEGKGQLETQQITKNPNQADHLEASVTALMGTLEVKRVFAIYPNIASITCTFYLRGKASPDWKQTAASALNTLDFNGIESQKGLNTLTSGVPVMDKLCFAGNHWQLRPVEFFDMTDRNNTLVKETTYNTYRLPGFLTGNLLFIKDLTTDYSFFILKEAPCSHLQLANVGFDFLVKNGSIQTVGIGILPTDISEKEWVRGYSYTLGLGGKTELETLQTLRSYQDAKHTRRPDRDEMLMMNTWGDRNKDAKISEKFILLELKKAAELGITHFQIDDGWQAGKSVNSAFAGGTSENIWLNPKYWTPDSVRFPNGFKVIVDEAKRLNLKLSLWFSPSRDSSYKHWEKDAEALIRLNRAYGIETMKVDFIQIEDKTSEVNFRKFLDKVQKETQNRMSFNLDVTAGRRNGYHFFNEYGNLYLENRYTDWTNYYPYWTLRNLWNLSKYVPAQNLQIEFLNKWRNPDKYPANDPFAPKNYAFDYLFAITMMAQPLAFFEATGLPDEGFSTAKLIKTYLQNRPKIHGGQIFPIGNEPNGRQWTGFQSIGSDTEGVVLVFREDNSDVKKAVKTWLPVGKNVVFTPIAGSGKAFENTVLEDGKVVFELAEKNSFGLFSYRIK